MLRSRDKAFLRGQSLSTMLLTLVAVLLAGLLFSSRVWYPSFQEVENQGIANGVDSLIGEGEDACDQPKLMVPCASLYVLTLCL